MNALSKAMTLLLLLALLAPPVPADDAPADPGTLREEAFSLYDQGRYAEAAERLSRLDAEGRADGPALYRLWYCRQAAGAPEADATLERALERLSAEVPTAKTLEPAFYLAGAYRQQGRVADATRVSNEAFDRLASGSLPEPAAAGARFRLGKLFADAGRRDEAAKWLTLAVETSREDPDALAAPYRRWAARYLAEIAWNADDFIGASDYFQTAFEDAPDSTWEDWDRTAVASCRAGRYLRCSAAWHRAKRVDPSRANRPRYGARVAQVADRLPDLSTVAPDGRLWIELTKPELEGMLTAQASRTRELRAEAEREKPLTAPRRNEIQAEIDAARTVFFGAALEYVLQGHDLREAAFVGGFAPLVFKGAEWQLPPPERRGQAKGRRPSGS